jgi:hypothetical protein
MVNRGAEIAKKIVCSGEYQRVLDDLSVSLKIAVEPSYDGMLIEFDGEVIELSKLNESELFFAVASRAAEIKSYSIKKFIATDNATCEQEYPSGEQPEEDDNTGEESEGVYSQGFLLINIVEFLLAERGDQCLLDFLKASRIPKAGAYAKQVRTFIS